MCVGTHANMRARTHTRTHARTQASTHARTNERMRTHAHTHAHTRIASQHHFLVCIIYNIRSDLVWYSLQYVCVSEIPGKVALDFVGISETQTYCK